MSRTNIVVPVIEGPTACADATDTWGRLGGSLTVIDNTPGSVWDVICTRRGWRHVPARRNLGVAASWNLGIALDPDANHHVLVSAGCVFTEGEGLLDAVLTLVGAGDARGCLSSLAFHLICFTPWLLEQAGTFDESFYPAYYEDNDYLRRLDLLGLHCAEDPMPKVHITAKEHNAKAIESGAVEPYPDWPALQNTYARKWGGTPGHERFETPYNVAGLPVSWWSTCWA